MDVHFFLEHRVAFLRHLYEATTAPFIERKRLIESGEPPFDFDSWCSEDGGPPFLDKWLDADQSLRVLGQMFISALAGSLELYLRESLTNIPSLVRHEKVRDMPAMGDYRKKFKGEGWFVIYGNYFKEHLGIDFGDYGGNLDALESLVLARNRSQHHDTITSLDAFHSKYDLKQVPNPFFADQRELELIGGDRFPSFFMAPTIKVTDEKMDAAFSEVEKFCSWLESGIEKWVTS